MASFEHSETPPSHEPATTGIQTPPDVPTSVADPIALPPLQQPPPQETVGFVRLYTWLDMLLVAVVLLFAFVVSLFPITNPDFFRQLAIGRMLAEGKYTFGVDPLVYTSEGYYVDHSWLFGLVLYGLYQMPAIDGAGLVILKGLAIAVLAGVMLRVGRRAGQSLWIPAACTLLALLAISPRLFLQPACLSLLFLGLTLWLLAGSQRGWWLLPPLFALWVNCDAWFVLGPLTVALYLLGEALQRLQSGEERDNLETLPRVDVRTLGTVLLVGIAACLLNPHHYHALRLPTELGFLSGNDLIERDAQFSTLFLSPLRKEYYEPVLGGSVAGVAYWPLLLVGLLSFVVVYDRLPWRWLAVWFGFALLSLYNMRAIPFFAVACGPLAAWNWLDFAERRAATAHVTKAQRNWSLGGRALTLLIGLALLLTSVPGWLQAKSGDDTQPYKNRRLGWEVRVDPSLEAMAQTIRSWREAGLLGDIPPHWFNLRHEIANYLAWYAPGEQVFLDRDMPQFHDAAADYVALRQALSDLADESSHSEGEPLALEQTRRLLRKYGVRYWIFDNRARSKADLVARFLLFTERKEWILCAQQGSVAIFAWHDPHPPTPAPSDPAQGLALHLQRAAFGPDAAPAPPSGPDPTVSPPPWWQIWQLAAPPSSLDRESAVLDELLYKTREQPQQTLQEYQNGVAWQTATAAATIPLALPSGPLPNNLLALHWSWVYHDLFPQGAVQPIRAPREAEMSALEARAGYINAQLQDPPAMLYLEVRAARRAVSANPEDAFSYFLLGQAYKRLSRQRLEQALLKFVPGTAEIRQAQAAAALQSFLRLQPDADSAADAHEILFSVYAQQNYLDAAVHHLRHLLAKRTTRRPSNIPPEQYSKMLDSMSAELTRRESQLSDRQNSYDVNTVRKTGLERVKVAMELGLTDTALAALEDFAREEIMNLDPNQQRIIAQVTAMAFELGRLDKARELLPNRDKLDGQPIRPDYVDFYVRLAAANGDYEEADRLLSDESLLHEVVKLQLLRVQGLRFISGKIPESALTKIARILLTGALKPDRLPPWDYMLHRWRLEAIQFGLLESQVRAQWYLTRAWLALEWGHNGKARQLFQKVREATVTGNAWVVEANESKTWFNPQQEIGQLQRMGFAHTILHDLSFHYLKWLQP